MKALSNFDSIYIYRNAIDMRQGIGRLCSLVQIESIGTLSERNIFVFISKNRKTMKALYFDKSGFCLWQKKLEVQRFPWPKKNSNSILVISHQQLEWLLTGYNVWEMEAFSPVKFDEVC